MIASFATKYSIAGIAIMSVNLTLHLCNLIKDILVSEVNEMVLEVCKEVFKELLTEIVPMALHCGVQFGSIQTLSSLPCIVKLNIPQVKKREEEGNNLHNPAA